MSSQMRWEYDSFCTTGRCLQHSLVAAAQHDSGRTTLLSPGRCAKHAPLLPAQIWDADEGGAAPADMAMPGTGVGMSHTSMRDFQELVTNPLGLPALCCLACERAHCAGTALRMSSI